MRRAWVRDAIVLLLPALLFGALHLRTLDYELVWTDVPELVDGSILRPPGRILDAFREPLHAIDDLAARPFTQPYYRPLQVITASLLDAHLGREPRVFRSVTLLLGAATAVLFTALSRLVLRSRAAALFAGCAFAVHPIALEIYVWVGGLAAALMALFLIGSIALGVLAIGARHARARAAAAAGSIALLCLGLLSKENAAVVPGIQLALLLGRFAPGLRDGRVPRADVLTGAALVAAQAGVVAAYLFVLRPAVLGTSLTGSPPIGAALSTQWLTSFALWPQSIGWLFAPLSSTTSDAVRVVASLSDFAPLAGLGLALASGALWVALLARGHGVAAAALAWIWIAFLPTSGLAPLLHAKAERNLFLSVFGASLLAATAGLGLRRIGAPRGAVLAVGLVIVGLLAERTVRRQPDWRSTLSLFTADVGADPRHREGRLNLIAAHADAGRLDEAKRHVDVLVTQRAPEGWTSYALDSSLLEAACRVNQAIGRDPDTPLIFRGDGPPAPAVWAAPGFYLCYAPALERLGRHAEALPIYEDLYRGSPKRARAPFAQGAARCHEALGDPDAARSWRERLRSDRRSGKRL